MFRWTCHRWHAISKQQTNLRSPMRTSWTPSCARWGTWYARRRANRSFTGGKLRFHALQRCGNAPPNTFRRWTAAWASHVTIGKLRRDVRKVAPYEGDDDGANIPLLRGACRSSKRGRGPLGPGHAEALQRGIQRRCEARASPEGPAQTGHAGDLYFDAHRTSDDRKRRIIRPF